MIELEVKNLNRLLNAYSVEDMQRICDPLKLLGIHHFHFSQIFNDESRISICNNKQWLESFYLEELFRKAYFFKSTEYHNGATVWFDVNESEVILKARDYFNITNNGITIVINKLESCKLYHFSSHNSDCIHQLKDNNFSLLYRFIDYFHERSHLIIKEALKSKLFFYSPSGKKTSISKDIEELFIQKTECSKFYVDEYDCYVSTREIEIIRRYIEGDCRESISEKFHISPKTVQTHINNVKQKLHCKKTSELIRLLQKISFM